MAGLREKILEATEALLRGGGASGVSTRAIAKAAGCSDGALYKHFESVDEVLLELFKRRLPSFTGVSQLPLRVGERTVERNVADVLSTGLEFMRVSMPIWMALMNDRQLRRAYYERLQGEGGGPHNATDGVAAYLRAEQRLGRVQVSADVKVAATLILAATTQRALFEQIFERQEGTASDHRWARDTARTLVRALAPSGTRPKGASGGRGK